MLAEAERRQVVSGWNDTAREIPPATLPGLFAAQVAGAPDAVAVTYEGTALTYRGLEEAANRLARHLITLGAAPESVVAVVMERSVLLITVLLAVVKAGAAYVPVDPGYPAGRVGFMLTDAAPVLVVTDAASAGAVPAGAVPAGAGVVVADDPATVAVLAGCGAGPVSDGERGGPVLAGGGAYVIYTSGSTGTPKGVAVSTCCGGAAGGDAGVVRVRRRGCVGVVSFVRVRLFCVGDMGGAGLRRAAGGGAVRGVAVAGGDGGAAGPRAGHGAESRRRRRFISWLRPPRMGGRCGWWSSAGRRWMRGGWRGGRPVAGGRGW